MQIHTVYTLLAVIIWIIVGTLIAVVARKGLGKGLSEYFIANRKIGGFVSALTYSATTYSAFMMIGLAGFAYKGGVGALGFELTYLAGLMLVVFFGPRFWLVGKKFGYVTPSQLLSDRYQNKGVAFIAALLCLIFLIPYSAVQLMGVAYLMEVLSSGGIPFIVGLLVAIIIAIVWAWIAGMRSVAWTDSLQALVMIITATTITFFVIYKGFGGFGGFFNKLELNYSQWLTLPGPGFFSFKVYLGLTLPWFFFSISNPQVSQRLFIPKSMRALKQMCGGFLIFGFVYTVITVLWGFSARLLCPDLSVADKASPALLALPLVPTVLGLIAMVAIMAAAISTIDSIMLSLSSIFAKDIYQNVKTEVKEERVLWVGKFIIPVIGVTAFFFARARFGLISTLSVASSAGLLMMVPTIIGAFLWRRGTAAGAIASMTVGAIITATMYITKWYPLGHWPGVWGGIMCSLVFIGVSLLTRPPRKRAEEFIDYLDKTLVEKNAL
ncbi:MAG: sodium:solute symporter family protein [Candidatus Aerophobetes bacterium]|nr:sodium:solute symporter family protein [Candidatus Aerophobetes bacterium]